MPVTLACDHPTLVQLEAVFGSRYAVIRWQVEGALVAAPVAISQPAACGDYQALCARSLRALLVPGRTIAVQAHAPHADAAGGLLAVDVIVDALGRTAQEQLISQGWALPGWPCDAAQQAALQWARHCRAGIWGEHGVSAATLGMPADLELATRPPPTAPGGALAWGCLAVLLSALAARRAPPLAGTPRRGWWRLAATALRWYGGGWLRPRAEASGRGAR